MTGSRTHGLEPLVAPSRSDLRGLIVVLGLAGASIVAGLAVWLVGASGDDGAPSVAFDDPSLTAESEGEEIVEAETTDEPIPLPLVTYELFLARDPFEPVVPEPVTAPADPSAPGSPAPGDGTGTTGPTSPDSNANGNSTGNANGNSTGNSGGNSGGAANGGCTGTSEVVCNGRVLTVIEVAEENGEMIAVIQVDTMRYRVGVGDVFADNFQVVSITPDQVKILYGDRVSTIEVGDNALK